MTITEKLRELREEQKSAVQRMQDFRDLPADDVTDEHRDAFDKDADRVEAIKAEIEKLEADEARQAKAAAAKKVGRDDDTVDTRTRIRVGEPGWTEDGNCGFRSVGHFALDVRTEAAGGTTTDHYREYKRWCETRAAGDGQAVNNYGDGGALVPTQMVETLLEKPISENPLLSQTTRVPITYGNTVSIPYINESSRATGSRQGGIRVYRTAEEGSYTSSKSAFGQLKLEAQKLTGLAYVSDELLRFSPVSVSSLLTTLFQREFQFKLTDEMVNGDTSNGQMAGILSAAATVSVSKESGQAADTIKFENVIKMWARRHRPSGPYVWLINQDAIPQLLSMTMPAGANQVPVYLPPNGLSGSPFATLFGAPVIEIEQAQTVGDKGDIMLVAPSQYVYAPVPGMDGQTSIHLKFDYGQTAYRFTMWATGAPWWSSALTPYKGSNTQSPFVTLAARA